MAYTDISRAVRLAEDHKNYMLWLNQSTEQRQTAFEAVNTPGDTARAERVGGYIAPFGATGATIMYVPSRLLSSTQTGRGGTLAETIRDIVLEYTKPTVAGTDLVISGAKQFKPAKLTVIQRVTTATSKSTSRITKRKYYRHENDSVTTNFGKKVVGDDFDSVVAAIKAKPAFTGLFAGSENALKSKYRFVPEGS